MIRSDLSLQEICLTSAEEYAHSSSAFASRRLVGELGGLVELPQAQNPPPVPPASADTPAARAPELCRHHSADGKISGPSFDDLIGESGEMRDVYRQIDQFAAIDSTVLVFGETGTGKELVSRSIHCRSARRNRPLIAVNCAAFSESLLDSELFGHVRGAFTDAHADRKGLFVLANGGTLLLDEIGEIPLRMQAKLLRTLEEGTVRPVGSEREIQVKVRLIAATHCNLERAVEEGRFRADLFYRINVIPLNLPPLRDRESDILLLARHFAQGFSRQFGKRIRDITPAAEVALRRFNWPGNVRELRNVIEQAVALSTRPKICLNDLPEKIRRYSGQVGFLPTDDPGSLISLREVERRYIRHVLQTVGGNKSLAAKTLGIARETLSRILHRQAGDE